MVCLFSVLHWWEVVCLIWILIKRNSFCNLLKQFDIFKFYVWLQLYLLSILVGDNPSTNGCSVLSILCFICVDMFRLWDLNIITFSVSFLYKIIHVFVCIRVFFCFFFRSPQQTVLCQTLVPFSMCWPSSANCQHSILSSWNLKWFEHNSFDHLVKTRSLCKLIIKDRFFYHSLVRSFWKY